jgi:hypothetical protein
MGRPTTRLITQEMAFICTVAGELTVILITIWWFQSLKERMTVSKQEAQKFGVERFNVRQRCELEVVKQYKIKISNRLAALKNLSESEDINRAWENIIENIKTSAKKNRSV